MQGSPWCVQYQAVWYRNRMLALLGKDRSLQLPHTSLHWGVRVNGTKKTAKLQASVQKDPLVSVWCCLQYIVRAGQLMLCAVPSGVVPEQDDGSAV